MSEQNRLSDQELYEQKYLKYKVKYPKLRAIQQGGYNAESLLDDLTGGYDGNTSEENVGRNEFDLPDVIPDVLENPLEDILNGGFNQQGGLNGQIRDGYTAVYDNLSTFEQNPEDESSCGALLDNVNKLYDSLRNMESMSGGAVEPIDVHHFTQLSLIFEQQASQAMNAFINNYNSELN